MKLTIHPIERDEAAEAMASGGASAHTPVSYAERQLLGSPTTGSRTIPASAFVPVPLAVERKEKASEEQPVSFESKGYLDEGTIPDDETSEDAGNVAADDFDAAEPLWKRSRWPAIIFISALLAFGALWYFASRSDNSLMLARVEVKGASLLSTREVLALANVDSKVPFYTIDLKAIETRLLKHSLIRSAHVEREVEPPTLVITIQERQPIALLRSDSSGEAFIVDRDGLLLRPKLIAGLRNPTRFLQVPLLTGVSEHDTAGYQAMAKLVTWIGGLDSGALAASIGELHRTPTGDFVIYTSATQTPLFIGSPFAHAFHTSLEEQTGTLPAYTEPLFDRQLELLARAWKAGLEQRVLIGRVLYVDARFNGQIVLKQVTSMGTNAPAPASASVSNLNSNNAHYASNATTIHQGIRTIH